MDVSLFDFDLPSERIAQRPLPERDASRLMVLPRRRGTPEHRRFRELPALLSPGDLMVVNDARVLPARLLGKKARTGGKVDVLLCDPLPESVSQSPDRAWRPRCEPREEQARGRTSGYGKGLRRSPAKQIGRQAMGAGLAYRLSGGLRWRCLASASKGLREGTEIELAPDFHAAVERELGEGWYELRFSCPGGDLEAALERAGRMPLPHYIHRETGADAEDSARYQTVYAKSPGAVAAPTAGLHFTEGILAALQARGVEVASVTLHVGPGTFLPVRAARIEDHRMHAERYQVPHATVQAYAAARARGARVVAVGTTALRTMEAAFDGQGLRAGPGETDLFLKPGDTVRSVDALLTNFHLPRSTLVMLVAALAGRERLLSAYAEAVHEGYRFFSYGDAMLVL